MATPHLNPILVIFSLSLSLSTVESYANIHSPHIEKICSKLLATTPTYTHLSPEQLAILHKHPIENTLNALPNGTKIQISPRTDHLHQQAFGGEERQAIFLKELLKNFPVRFQSFSDLDLGSKNVISLHIMDSAEIGRQTDYPSSNVVEMSDIKIANGIWETHSPRENRPQLNLPISPRIAHLYMRDPYTDESDSQPGLDNPDFMIASEQLLDAGADIVILSSRMLDDFKIQQRIFQNDYPGIFSIFDSIVPLSGVLDGSIDIKDRKGKVLVVNDTMGKMNDLYRASDVALVIGPINFYEPLYAGVPTYLLMNKKVRAQYNPVTMAKMISYAEDFPNFIMLASLSEKFPKPVPSADFYPYEPFERFLDILNKKIQNQLAKRPPKSHAMK